MEKENAIEVEYVETDINSMELIVKHDESKNQMVTNAVALREELNKALSVYDYEVTEGNKKDAEADRAALNKLKDKIAGQRKNAKKQILGTWADDEKIIVQMEKDIKQYADALGSGIVVIDLKAKEEKKASIKAWWDKKQTGIPYELVHKDSFLNKTTSGKKVKDELENRLIHINQDKEIIPLFIEKLSDDDKAIVWDTYNKTLDVQSAREKADELIRIREQQKIEQEIKEKEKEYVEQVQKEENRTPSISETVNMTSEEPTWILTCKIPQFAILFETMKNNGITSKSFDVEAVKGTFTFYGNKDGFVNFKNQLEQNGFEITDIKWKKGE